MKCIKKILRVVMAVQLLSRLHNLRNELVMVRLAGDKCVKVSCQKGRQPVEQPDFVDFFGFGLSTMYMKGRLKVHFSGLTVSLMVCLSKVTVSGKSSS